MKTVVTLGESLIDFVATSPGSLTTSPAFHKAAGGAPANVAACVAKLGGQARFVGKRGTDPFGDFLVQTLDEFGVDTRYFTPTPEQTSLAFVALSDAGDRSFTFYRTPGADTRLDVVDITDSVFEGAAVLHVGSVSMTAEPSCKATHRAVQMARDCGVLVSYDPNWRPALWSDPEAGLHTARALLELADIVKVNREELVLFTGVEEPEKGAAILHAIGAQLVLVTLDAEGCYYSYLPKGRNTSLSSYVPGMAVHVVDTTGAGDAFTGAVLYRLSARADKLSLTDIELRNMVEFAVAVSALTTTKRGAIAALPSLYDVETLL